MYELTKHDGYIINAKVHKTRSGERYIVGCILEDNKGRGWEMHTPFTSSAVVRIECNIVYTLNSVYEVRWAK